MERMMRPDRARWGPSDIKVLDDPLNLIRGRPRMFLWRDTFEPTWVLGQIAEGAMACGAQTVTIARRGAWWTLWSETDWLASMEPLVTFRQIVAFPEIGVNSHHQEILLTAFATNVVTASRRGVEVIKGSSDADIEELCAHAARGGRLIAFSV